MNNEIFKEDDLIFSYTDEQAISDGTIHRLGIDTPHRVTNNLFVAIQKKNESSIEDTLNLILNEVLILLPYAEKTFNEGGILKTDFRFKVGNFKHSEIIWFIVNENRGITVMKPEDY